MTQHDPAVSRHLRAAGLALVVLLLGTPAAYPSHSAPPPPPPPGHGQLLVRLVRPTGAAEAMPEGHIRVEAVELHRAGAAADSWIPLPLIRIEFSPHELLGGQVWVADVPLPAGEFDQIRVDAGGSSHLPIALRLVSGKWSILSLEVGFQGGRARGPLRLTLKGTHTDGPY